MAPKSLFQQAEGGTLFLDEVGELPASVHGRLLRALQHKEVMPLGATEAVPIDIRVISATHRDPEATSDFRVDLFYRLNVVRLRVAPLRERREDIPLLVRHFLDKHRSAAAGIEDDALEALMRREWPGNVRELENAVEAALALATGRRLQLRDFRTILDSGSSKPPETKIPLSLDALREVCARASARGSCR